MLSDELKSTIQGAYTALLDAKGYAPRSCQKHMIAEVARTLSVPREEEREGHSHVAVVEAGTGTGKTIAYLVATLPIARARQAGGCRFRNGGASGATVTA